MRRRPRRPQQRSVSRVSSRPASPQARSGLQTERREGREVSRHAPRHPAIVRGRSPGLWDQAYRLPASSRSQWLGCSSAQSARPRPRVDTPARTYRCGGSRGIGSRILPPRLRGFSRGVALDRLDAGPLSRFNPARGSRRDTSNERLDCTTQVLFLQPIPVWESTLKTNPYTLT